MILVCDVVEIDGQVSEVCECQEQEQGLKCPAWDQICRRVLIDNIPTQECQCRICEEEERVCTVEAIDGVEQDVCRCPEQTTSGCDRSEQICFKEDDSNKQVCLCPDDGCDQ